MAGKHISLRKSVFTRLLIITIAFVLLFYSLGLVINQIGITNVRTQIADLMEADAGYIAEELDRDITNLSFFCREICSDRSVMHYVLLYDSLTACQKITYIQTVFDRSYQVRRFSPIAATVKVMMPLQGICISTSEDMYSDLDPDEWNGLLRLS